jgi:hypothetical protein
MHHPTHQSNAHLGAVSSKTVQVLNCFVTNLWHAISEWRANVPARAALPLLEACFRGILQPLEACAGGPRSSSWRITPHPAVASLSEQAYS